jgi:hypothetical protein
MRHQRVLTLTLKGKSLHEIARDKRVGMNHETVKALRNTEEFRSRQEKASRSINEQVTDLLAKQVLGCLRKLVRLAKKGTNADKIQFEASKEILYMMGIKPIEVVETRQRPINPSEVQSAKVTLTEIEATINRLSKRESTFIMQRMVPPPEIVKKTECEAQPETAVDPTPPQTDDQPIIPGEDRQETLPA